ncbi:MAG: adhesin, partial [Betaproteobacteria bacterium]|nr:adhesin [Betaproteobacteria bacterium]
MTQQTNVLCNGGSTGSLDITVSGGTASYSYAWNNGATSQDINTLAAGTYSVTVTDANGCTAQGSYTITQPSALQITLNGTTNILCNGGNNGSINVSVSGGTGGYTYLWSSGQTSEDLTNLIAGTYSVTVTDANGCTAQGSYTITQPN